ncbi:hypothetical protein [Streptomyces mutomycini]|uniref:hypothetical protein n=1 Tax=Streptomyces mutomycini TaxID=284036 RepID=UPI0033FA6A28
MALGPAKPVFDRMDLASAITSKLYAQGADATVLAGDGVVGVAKGGARRRHRRVVRLEPP